MSKLCKVCGARCEGEYCFRHRPKKRIKQKKDRGKYFAIYLKYFGYDLDERPICEITGTPADQIHHMDGRGTDDPETLIALTYELHQLVETIAPRVNEDYREAHQLFIKTRKPLYLTNPTLCSRIFSLFPT